MFFKRTYKKINVFLFLIATDTVRIPSSKVFSLFSLRIGVKEWSCDLLYIDLNFAPQISSLQVNGIRSIIVLLNTWSKLVNFIFFCIKTMHLYLQTLPCLTGPGARTCDIVEP